MRRMRADMGDRVRIEFPLQPRIKGEILVMWRHDHVVIELFDVLLPAARWLWREQNIAVADRREDEIRLPLLVMPDHDGGSFGLAPLLNHRTAQFLRQLIEPVPVSFYWQHGDCFFLDPVADQFFQAAGIPIADIAALVAYC